MNWSKGHATWSAKSEKLFERKRPSTALGRCGWSSAGLGHSAKYIWSHYVIHELELPGGYKPYKAKMGTYLIKVRN